jgi:hypothetical protein
MDIKIVRLGTLDDDDFEKAVDIDVDNWWPVLVAEYGTEDKGVIFGKQYARFLSRCEQFPEGEIAAYCYDLKRPVGVISSLRINADSIEAVPDTWHALTGNGFFEKAHVKDGNMLACVSITTLKRNYIPKDLLDEYRRQRVSGRLIRAQLALANKLYVDHMIAYSRPMDYAAFAAAFPSIEAYREAIESGKVYDKSIGMHLKEGGKILRIIPGGRPKDPEALGYNFIIGYNHRLEKNIAKMQENAVVSA